MSRIDHHLEHNGRGHKCDWTLKFWRQRYKCKTLLDVGAGVGLNCAWASYYHGYIATGIEADGQCKKVHDDIVIHDFVTDGVCKFDRIFDLGWSVATSEHIDEKGADNYVETFLACKHVVFTWCPPGYPGYHHVNCQYQPYWIDKFQNLGFIYDEKVSNIIKSRCEFSMIKNLDRLQKRRGKGYLKDWATVFHNPKIT